MANKYKESFLTTQEALQFYALAINIEKKIIRKKLSPEKKETLRQALREVCLEATQRADTILKEGVKNVRQQQ
ncbi:hypothetical protein [Helicobacter cinaedi]|uniref:hypothetical protein n=1 Tax=Helicobacter cinaedi TaxID=213 RepID=UPI000D7CCFA6|nr:hypothetical protein [Helicobacter cinaedi]